MITCADSESIGYIVSFDSSGYLYSDGDKWSPLKETKDNIVKEAFGGHLVSKLRCSNCGYSSVTREPLIDLILENEDVESVPSTLESFTKIEKIEFSCERCKTQGSFEKQLLVDHSPIVDPLHLKRFKNNGLDVQKVEKHVSFPLELDMLLYNNDISNAYILFYAKRGTPWFSDYIQIHRPFVCLVTPITSNDASDEPTLMSELNNVEDNNSYDQVYCEDQLHDVEIKQDEEMMDALNCGSHGIHVNEKKRKPED
ncbi:hypothetical protein MTR67_034650 [Solanum verrucosum]|uniref:USP domain-containing protein n=1 Tax=Solanum verrucosum TaxID=315347 RepID=A0AAF0U8N2_SOLVR|nr:hypothetical protein MTR67_034650 [Solanum verrucosum]